MQVNDTRKKSNMVFELVKVGEVFSWEGELYMRTKLCMSKNSLCNTVNIEVKVGEIFEYCDSIYIKSGGSTSSSYAYNAICLEDGK